MNSSGIAGNGIRRDDIVICEANKALHFIFAGTIYEFTCVKKRFEPFILQEKASC